MSDSKFLSDFGITESKIAEGKRLINIPSKGRPSFDSMLMERVAINAKNSSNLGDALASGNVRFGNLDVEGRRAVVLSVAASVHNNKVLNSVIESIPIDMMDDLIGIKGSANAVLDDPSMLKDALTIDSESAIPAFIDVAFTKLTEPEAFDATEIVSGAIDMGFRSAKSSGALGANDFHGATITPERSGGKKIKKQDVLDFIDANQIQIKEVEKGSAAGGGARAALERIKTSLQGFGILPIIDFDGFVTGIEIRGKDSDYILFESSDEENGLFPDYDQNIESLPNTINTPMDKDLLRELLVNNGIESTNDIENSVFDLFFTSKVVENNLRM